MALAAILKNGPQAIGDGVEPGPGDWLYDFIFILPLLAAFCLSNTSASLLRSFLSGPTRGGLMQCCFLYAFSGPQLSH